ncbi:MAG: hypothetical protein V2J08_01060, partial [Desulfotignum sp.]|nr:hypothetical protein [Desulfotignum sp.]
AARQAGNFAFSCLEQVAVCRDLLRHRSEDLLEKFDNQAFPVPVQMVKNALVFDVPDLTPMAAVAGSIADRVADFLFQKGVSKVIVDNGGDVAVRLSGDETARVGIRSDIASAEITHVIMLNSRCLSWGINTSGLGGRSFTRGIATAATVVAHSSARADAAATDIANACFSEDAGIVQVPAGQLDPMTDIPDIPVTVLVKDLKPETIARSLKRSLDRAAGYVESGLIMGAIITAGGKTVHTGLPPGFLEIQQKGLTDGKN